LGRATKLSVDEIVSTPSTYINQNISVVGFVSDVSIHEATDDITLLSIELAGTISKDSPVNSSIILSDALNDASNIIVSSEEGFFLNLPPEELRLMRYKLLSESSKLKALSYYLLSYDMNRAAQGCSDLSKAYKGFAKAYEHLIDNRVRIEEGSGLKLSLGSANPLIASFESLIGLSNSLVEYRDEIALGHSVIAYNDETNKVANIILSRGHILRSESFNMAMNDEDTHRVDAEASFLIGFGESINSAVKSVEMMSRDVPKEVQSFSTFLDCYHYGYNDWLLEYCSELINREVPLRVVLYGTLVKGDMREKIDVLWLNVSYVEVDGMIIDLSYNDRSSTSVKIKKLYNWAQDLDE
jgi:hypothetical protein